MTLLAIFEALVGANAIWETTVRNFPVNTKWLKSKVGQLDMEVHSPLRWW